MLGRSRKTRFGEAGEGRGFTLVELLVVVSIISLLMGILMPVLGKVRKNGRRTACLAQLHNIGLAMRIYVSENNDTMPVAAQLPSTEPNLPCITDVLLPYLKVRKVNPQAMFSPERFNLMLQYVDPHTRARLREHIPAMRQRMAECGIPIGDGPF